METPSIWCVSLLEKITPETEFSTVSVCWGLLDEREEATWIFSQTLVLWYGLRRRKWHFWTILDCSVNESFRMGGKNPAVCAIIVWGNLRFSRWQKCFENKEWVGDSQRTMTGALVHRRQQRADNGLNSPAHWDAAADHISCIYICLFPNWSIPSFT